MSDKLISDQRITDFTNTLEECIMDYYNASINEDLEGTAVANYKVQKPHLNFYESYQKIADYFLDDIALDLTSQEECKKIEDKLDALKSRLEENEINCEEVRRSLLFLDIKGFKNLNFSLDLITPDGISMIVSELVKYMFKDKKHLTILDPNFGIGNLVFTIANNCGKECDLIGFDNHELMAIIAAYKANFLATPLEMHYDDMLIGLINNCDVVVSDLAVYDYENDEYKSPLFDQGVKYFPYLAIEHLLNFKFKTKYIFIIDNNFFSYDVKGLFKESLKNKGSIKALVTLPLSFFQNPQDAKSLLIMDNNPSNMGMKTEVFSLPSLSDKANFMKVLKSIEDYLKND